MAAGRGPAFPSPCLLSGLRQPRRASASGSRLSRPARRAIVEVGLRCLRVSAGCSSSRRRSKCRLRESSQRASTRTRSRFLSAEGQKLSGSFCYKTEYGYDLSGERPGAETRDAKAKIECAPLLSPHPFQGARRRARAHLAQPAAIAVIAELLSILCPGWLVAQILAQGLLGHRRCRRS